MTREFERRVRQIESKRAAFRSQASPEEIHARTHQSFPNEESAQARVDFLSTMGRSGYHTEQCPECGQWRIR